MNTLSKEAMDPEPAKQLFVQHYSNATQYEHNESVLLLLEGFQYLPLGIVQTAAYLCLSPAEYLTLFNNTRDAQKRLLSKAGTFFGRDANAETIFSTFSITFRQLEDQASLASSLLKFMACIDHQGIPHELLLRSGIEGSDEATLNEALSKLINFSLLTTLEHGREHGIHSLVHLSIEEFLSPNEMGVTMERAATVLARILPETVPEN